MDLFALAVLAGAFIALGAAFATTVARGRRACPTASARLLAGLAFSLGLILVVVAGAELFTGNNLIVMAWASGRIATVGAAAELGDRLRRQLRRRVRHRRARVRSASQYTFGGGVVGTTALTDRRGQGRPRVRPGDRPRRALQRARLPRRVADLRRAHDDRQGAGDRAADRGVRRDRLRALRRQHVLRPGRAPHPARPRVAGRDERRPATRAASTWGSFLVDNLLPVTIGNVIGGGLLVGAVYWFVYLRRSARDEARRTTEREPQAR